MAYAFDPELVAVIPQFPRLDCRDVHTARAQLSQRTAQLPAPDTTGLVISDRRVPGRNGDPEVLVRLYRPARPAARAAIYDVHAGGFMLGGLELDHARNVTLARELGVLVAAVEYRLAPETPFPGPLEDVYTGLDWLAAHGDELGIDPRRIALHGISAGGGLCAGLTLLARDRGGPHVAFQFLAIPVVDDRLATPSMVAYTDTPGWDQRNATLSWDAYLGPGKAGSDAVSPYAAPARATDLTGLPPAYVSVMHFDPLRDEGIAYALALLAADVPVELHLFPGTFHGSSGVQQAAISRREASEAITVLRHALALT